jgi:pyrimidine operon attenuation protein/uracil phosphoribosyltransferase
MNLPDTEQLCAKLIAELRPVITPRTAMVGIYTGGLWLAERLHQALGIKAPLGALDISFYRDDFDTAGLHHTVHPSQIPFEVDGAEILLVDDVLYTGRTVRAAMNELFDYGRPASISLVVVADRGERQLPIAAQYCGTSVTVPPGKLLRLTKDEAGKFSMKLSDKKEAKA